MKNVISETRQLTKGHSKYRFFKYIYIHTQTYIQYIYICSFESVCVCIFLFLFFVILVVVSDFWPHCIANEMHTEINFYSKF